MIWCCVSLLTETCTSQLSGRVGGARGSVQTGHPAVVMDDFHQGAYGFTWEMYMKTSAFGWYLSSSSHTAGCRRIEKSLKKKDKDECSPLLKVFITLKAKQKKKKCLLPITFHATVLDEDHIYAYKLSRHILTDMWYNLALSGSAWSMNYCQ